MTKREVEARLSRREVRLLRQLRSVFGSEVVKRRTPAHAAAARLVEVGLARWADTDEGPDHRRVRAPGARVDPEALLMRELLGRRSVLVVRDTPEFVAAERLVADGLAEWCVDFTPDDPLHRSHRRVRLVPAVRDQELQDAFRRGYEAAMDELGGWLRERRPLLFD